MKMNTYKFSVFSCGCGYTTGDNSNARKHKKVSCGHDMTHELKEFVLKKDIDSVKVDVLAEKNRILEQNTHTISQLHNTITRLQNSLAKMSKTVDIVNAEDCFDDTQQPGIIYFITDKDVPDRGKIGRTKNTNV